MNCNTLASACRANEDHMSVVLDKQLEKTVLLEILRSWNDYIVDFDVHIEFELVFCPIEYIFPADPESSVDEEISRCLSRIRNLRTALNSECLALDFVDFCCFLAQL